MHFDGFGIAGYRSFGQGLTKVGPLRRVTLIAGVNNVGKSNALRFAELIVKNVSDPSEIRRRWDAGLDDPEGLTNSVPVLGVPIPLRTDAIIEMAGRSNRLLDEQGASIIVDALNTPAFHAEHGLAWVRFRLNGLLNGPVAEFVLDDTQIPDAMPKMTAHIASQLGTVSSALTNTAGGNLGDDLKRILGALQLLQGVPPVAHIGAFRQVRPRLGQEQQSDHDGQGLVETLATYDRPKASERHFRKKFDAINRFVQIVLGDDSYAIEIPHDNATINVRQGDLLLPLESLGTGVHEVVIMAAAATVLDGYLVCIEEPEVHLHPTLQRQLLRYLEEETTNQYLIATHSAQLLDAPEAAILHATKDGHQTRLDLVSNSRAQAEVCRDLGYRASDLVQSNAVVWVEGPSDRVYLRHWLAVVAPDLLEGVHYSLMFYGGSLLKHLSLPDPDEHSLGDFISLRRLNRNSHIMIDSDRGGADEPLSEAKVRVIEEFADGGIAWVTAGRTIENYVPTGVLHAAIATCHPLTKPPSGGQYRQPLKNGMDKVRIARAVVDEWDLPTDDWPFDLASQLTTLAAALRRANGLSD